MIAHDELLEQGRAALLELEELPVFFIDDEIFLFPSERVFVVRLGGHTKEIVWKSGEDW